MAKARILSLADGTVTLLPRGVPPGAAVRVTLADDSDAQAAWVAAHPLLPQPFVPAVNVPSNNPTGGATPPVMMTDVPAQDITNPYPRVLHSWSDNGHMMETRQLSEGYIETLGDSLERFASMTLARKLRSPAPITADEANMMVGLAGVPRTRAGQMLTAQILQASADELGKGGVIGSISKAVSSVAQKVIVPVTRVMAAAAPILNKVPVIGPALGAAVTLQYNAANAMAHGNLSSLTSGGVAGTISHLVAGAGDAVGAVAAIGGAGVQGLIQAPGTIASDIGAAGTWLAQGASGLVSSVSSYLGGDNGSGGFFSSLISSGKSLVSTFDASVASAIEGANPSLSGELTSMFHSLGSEYTNFQHVFDSWSASMKSAPTGTAAVGSLNGNLYSMVKDAMGHISLTQTPAVNAPASASTLPNGSLTPAAQLSGLGVPTAPAGSGYGPGASGSVAGLPTNPAGVSLPGGPINPGTDPTSIALFNQAANQANAGKRPAGTAAASPQLAGFPLWAVVGLGGAALFALFKGGPKGPMKSLGQGWHVPAKRRSSKRRR